MANVGYATLQIIPSMRGTQGAVAKGMTGQAAAAGAAGGQAYSKRFGSVIGAKLKTFAKIAGPAIAGVALFKLGKSGVQAAAGIDKAQRTLTGLYGSGKLASKTMAGLNKVAEKSPLGHEAFYKGAQSLAYAGIKGKDATKVLKNMGLAISSIGGSSENMDRANDAILKMVNAGKVSLDSLQQLSNAGVPIISGLAAKFGKSNDEINKMASSGKIGLQDVISVMKNATGANFQKATKAGAKTNQSFAASWARIKDNVAHALGETMLPLIKQITPLMDTIAQKAPGAIGAMAAAFGRVITAVQAVVAFFRRFQAIIAPIAAGIGAITAAFVAYKTAMLIASGITKAFAAVQALLNAVMAANPVTLIILALVGLGAALVVAYKKSATFRAIVQAAWAGIRKAVSVAWRAVIRPALHGIATVIRKVVAPVVRWLWKAVFRPAFKGIRLAVRIAWTILKVIFGLIRIQIKITGAIAKWLWRKAIRPAFRGIAKVAKWLWHNVIAPVFRGIGKVIKAVWRATLKPVFNALSRIITKTVPHAFRTGVAAIRKAWNKVRAAARKPVKFVVNTILNKGIIKGYNWLAGKFGVKKVKPIKLGFRHGGAVHGPGGPTGDKIPADLSNNEHVWTAREVRGAGGHGAVERMRAAAASGQRMPFAKGGRASLIAFGKWLRRHGARVGENPAFGGVSPVHTRNSWHYRGGAIDVNYGPPGSSKIEKRFFNKLIKSGIARRKYGLRSIWRYPGHYNHAHFDLGSGPDLGMHQGGSGGIKGFFGGILGWLSGKAKKAWNLITGLKGKIGKGIKGAGPFGKMVGNAGRKIVGKAKDWFKDKLLDTLPFFGGGGGGGHAVSGHGSNVAIVRRTARQFGWAKGAQWNALRWLISHESGFRNTVKNPTSSAYGMFQFLDSTWSTVGGHKTSNPALQALYGMRYIKKRYRSPLGAKAFWRGHNWYAKGTTNAAPGWAVVGEQGPELVNFRGGEQVRSASESKRALATTPEVHVFIGDRELKDIVRVEQREHDRHTRRRVLTGAGVNR